MANCINPESLKEYPIRSASGWSSSVMSEEVSSRRCLIREDRPRWRLPNFKNLKVLPNSGHHVINCIADGFQILQIFILDPESDGTFGEFFLQAFYKFD